MNKDKSKKLDEMLNFDPLHTAEKIVGEQNDISNSIGMNLMLQNNLKKKEILNELGDSTFSCTIEKYFDIIINFGFEQIYEEVILKCKDDLNDDVNETFYVFWHRELNILLNVDTYRGNVNGSKFYYNWFVKFNKKHGSTSSGCFLKEDRLCVHFDENQNKLNEKEIIEYPVSEETKKHNKNLFDTTYGVWIGYHDGREAILHNINKLNENGEFLNTWIESDYSCNHSRDYDKNVQTEDVSLKRMERFPEEVKERINYKQLVKEHNRIKNLRW